MLEIDSYFNLSVQIKKNSFQSRLSKTSYNSSQTIASDLNLVDIILVWNHFLKEKSIILWQKTPFTRLVKTKSMEWSCVLNLIKNRKGPFSKSSFSRRAHFVNLLVVTHIHISHCGIFKKRLIHLFQFGNCLENLEIFGVIHYFNIFKKRKLDIK